MIIFQRSQVLGNKIEMEITALVEKNPTLLRLGLHLEYNDARHRIATHLQRNIDTSTLNLIYNYFRNIFSLDFILSSSYSYRYFISLR